LCVPPLPSAADVFRAVSDPTRRQMLDLLSSGERTAAELAAPFEMTQPAVSQHLRVLREAKLVDVRKEGRHRIYMIDPSPLREVFDWAQYYERFWRRKLTALGRELDRIP
jgi:DNA-binding transcriptional ArsR family regulator